MKGKIQTRMISIILSVTVFTMLSLSFVLASTSTITADAATSRATLGTSIVITSQITADSSGSSGSAYLTCSPSTYSVAEGSQSFSLSESQSTTKTFTFSASQSGTYSCQVTDGTVSSSPATTLTIEEPTVLTITGDSSSVSKTSGQTFTLSITLTNSQSSAITSSYALSLPSGYSASGDPTSSSGTGFAVGATTLSWIITAGSSSGTITFQLGSNTNAFSKAVTISSTSESPTITTTPQQGGASKPTVTVQRGKTSITIPSIAAGKMAIVNISKTEESGVRQITISVKNSVNSIYIDIAKLPGKPANIIQSVTGNVYHYMEINKTNLKDADIDKIKIRFAVNKSWMDKNNISADTLTLNRFTTKWDKLTTVKVNETADELEYEAESPGLSVFAISGESKAAAAPEVPAAPQQPAAEEKLASEKKPLDMTFVYVSIAIIVAVGILIYFAKYKKKKQR